MEVEEYFFTLFRMMISIPETFETRGKIKTKSTETENWNLLSVTVPIVVSLHSSNEETVRQSGSVTSVKEGYELIRGGLMKFFPTTLVSDLLKTTQVLTFSNPGRLVMNS